MATTLPPERGSPAADSRAGDWEGGWWRHARRCPSPNFGPRPPAAEVDLLVVHSISLPPGAFGGDAVARLFTNTLDWEAHPYYATIRGLRVSSHFFLQRDGAVWQFVDCDDRAWHAGVSAYRGRAACNDDSVGIELEGIEGGRFTDAQYEALCTLAQAVARRYPVRHVAGHEDIAPGRKSDPGPGFDWARLQAALDWPREYFPERVR